MHGCRQLIVVRCWVKSTAGATPIVSCHHSVGHSGETAGNKPEEEVGMTSNHHAPYDPGPHDATMAGTTSRKPVTAANLKASLSSVVGCSPT